MPKFNSSWRACIALSLLTGALAACGGSSGDGSAGSSTGSNSTATSTNKTDATSTSPRNSGDSDVRFAP